MIRLVGKARRAATLVLVSCLGLAAGCRHPKTWTLQPTSTPPPPELGSGNDKSKDYNLVWTQTSSNKTPLNPEWGSQPGNLPPAQCGADQPYDCTVQKPVKDSPQGLNDAFCALAAIGQPFHGHADWGVAEFRGAIGWLNFNAFDGDYCWVLKPDHLEGVTPNNFPQVDPKNPQFLELEFDSRETAPHFGDEPDAKWWPGLSDKAWDGFLNGKFDDLDNYLHPGTSGQDKQYLACGVVTGLFGLDCDHGCRSEVHPVYTLALQTNEDPADNEWVVMVRNWGAGGFCSAWNDEVTAQQIVVDLPVTSDTGPTDVRVEQFAGTADVGCPTYGYVAGEGEKLVFDLPAPTPEKQGMAVMVVKMQWPKDAKTMQCNAVDVNNLRTWRGDPVSGTKEMDVDSRLSRAMREAGLVPQRPSAPHSSRDISRLSLAQHPPKAALQQRIDGAETKTLKLCPAPTVEHALTEKLAKTPTETPRKKLEQDAAAAARNQAQFIELCKAYSKQAQKTWPELEQFCAQHVKAK
jgi:hypothetical protein